MEKTLLCLFAFAICVSGQTRPPNILYIIADDLGYNDVSWHDPSVITPNLESLARGGLILEGSYVQPVCTPTRSAIMSGYYPIHIGRHGSVLEHNMPTGLFTNLTLLPEHLRGLGYRTHAVGKWHLGFCNEAYLPTNRGFDTFRGKFLGGGDYNVHLEPPSHEPDVYPEPGYDLRNGLDVDFKGFNTYSTFLFTNETRSIITEPSGDLPFFIWLAYQTPHTPLMAPDEFLEMYPNEPDGDRKTMLAMITAMDSAIGDLVETLKESGEYENTLIVFTADNGGSTRNGASNFPLRGGKSTLWEGGTRAAAFIHAPFLNFNGDVYNGLIHAADWLPTLYKAAGGNPSDLGQIDGVDQWVSLKRREEPSQRSEMLYNINPYPKNGAEYPSAAIRFNEMKLVLGNVGDSREVGDTIQLFNLTSDPSETLNVAADHTDLVADMIARVAELKSETLPPDDPPQTVEGNPDNFGGFWSPGWC